MYKISHVSTARAIFISQRLWEQEPVVNKFDRWGFLRHFSCSIWFYPPKSLLLLSEDFIPNLSISFWARSLGSRSSTWYSVTWLAPDHSWTSRSFVRLEFLTASRFWSTNRQWFLQLRSTPFQSLMYWCYFDPLTVRSRTTHICLSQTSWQIRMRTSPIANSTVTTTSRRASWPCLRCHSPRSSTILTSITTRS